MSRRRSSIAGVPTLTPPMRVGADRFVRQHTLEHAPWLADDRAVTPCAPDQRHGRPADITAAAQLLLMTLQLGPTGAPDQTAQLQSP
jgi:hypothetical protein